MPSKSASTQRGLGLLVVACLGVTSGLSGCSALLQLDSLGKAECADGACRPDKEDGVFVVTRRSDAGEDHSGDISGRLPDVSRTPDDPDADSASDGGSGDSGDSDSGDGDSGDGDRGGDAGEPDAALQDASKDAAPINACRPAAVVEPSDACSRQTAGSVQVIFQNSCATDGVRLSKVDAQCNEVKVQVIPPGRAVGGAVNDVALWRLRNDATGQLLREVTLSATGQNHFVVP